jgi:2-oxo-4-hydroxy-4-carboxy-5-ureidoimidazoline decarboxylase
MTLEEINALPDSDFVERLGDIAEHAPWVAARAALDRPFPDRDALIAAFQRAIVDGGVFRQNELLGAHPDLAGRAAIAGEVTDASRREQAGAGLGSLTTEELNGAYRQRFGFPFILAVRGADKHAILASFEARLEGTPDEERLTALAQVLRIVRFRLADTVIA